MSKFDMDYFTSCDTCPLDEDGVQVSENDYLNPMREEASRYREMLRNRFAGFDLVEFRTKRNAHDFGSYYDIEIWYFPASDKSLNQAIFIENHLPRTWDDDEVFKWSDELMQEVV